MISKIAITTLIAFLSINSFVFADSPLTSTPFSNAFLNEPIIIAASQSKGALTNELMEYLSKKRNPIAIKMAIINQLGWDLDGKGNASVYFDFLLKKKHYNNDEDFINKASADELLCIAYLKAMDNYFNVDDAIKYTEYALQKNSKSFTFQIITAIIKAQKAMDSDWCEIFRLTDHVRTNTALKKDMKEEASTIIYDYMDIYKCE